MLKRDLSCFLCGVAALLVSVQARPTIAAGLAPAELVAATPPAASTLASAGSHRTLPFRQSAGDMRLEGEDATRELSFHLSPDQVAGGGAVRLSYLNAVSVLPDDAVLDVELNGEPLETLPIRSPNGPMTHDLPVAAAKLVPGWNTVRIRARQHHRIDCSVDASYELWTQIDPLVSGFVTKVEPKDGDLASLLSVGRNGDGATEIRLIASPETPQATVRDSLSVVQTLALVLGRSDLAVAVGAEEGMGPGIDLYVGDPSRMDLPQSARDTLAGAPRGLFVRQKDGGRLALTMRASNTSELQSLLLAAVNGPLLPLIRANRAQAEGSAIDGATPATHALSDVGYRTAPFAGRLFQTSFTVIMPSDFYPGDYATVDLHLNAATAPGLSPGTQLLVRVNERAVATQVLYNPEGMTLKDKPLELPLRSFHPGVNHVRILAELPTAADKACDPSTRDEARSRFLMLQETTVTIPPLARAGRLPDLAAFAGTSFPFTGSTAFDVFVDAATPSRLGSALTLLTRMAISAGHPLPAEIRIGRPDPRATTDALVIVASGDMPEKASLEGRKGERLQPFVTDALTTASVARQSEDSHRLSDSEALLNAFQVETRLEEDKRSLKSRATNWFAEASTTVNRWLSYKEIGRDDIHVDSRDRMISVRQVRAPESDAVWTIVAASDETSLASGMSTLTGPATWMSLEGGEAIIRHSDSKLVTLQPDAYSFFPITDTSPANLRRLAAAWLSDNFVVYVALIVILMGGFGWWVGYIVPRKGVRTIE